MPIPYRPYTHYYPKSAPPEHTASPPIRPRTNDHRQLLESGGRCQCRALPTTPVTASTPNATAQRGPPPVTSTSTRRETARQTDRGRPVPLMQVTESAPLAMSPSGGICTAGQAERRECRYQARYEATQSNSEAPRSTSVAASSSRWQHTHSWFLCERRRPEEGQTKYGG